tara:strand:- start:198 stop:470 length:273 start_codon:yes stop_codon:yes gene_type:complete
MNTEEKLLELHNVLVTERMSASKTESTVELDTDKILDAVEDAIFAIHGLQTTINAIKELVKGVKWYEFLKLFAIIQDIVKIIKDYEWLQD